MRGQNSFLCRRRGQQDGPVMEYIDLFEKISGLMKDINPMKGIFVNGMKGPIRVEVSLGLATLEEIKDRALLLGEK